MNTRALIIGAAEMIEIVAAIANARLKPVPKHVIERLAKPIPQDRSTLRLKDRPKGWNRDKYKPTQVLLEVGYRCAISFEDQPQAGLCRHLSISIDSDVPEALPHRDAVMLIARAFNVPLDDGCLTWIEEFEPGKFAVNMIAVEPKLNS